VFSHITWIERSWRELAIDVADHRSILKYNLKYHLTHNRYRTSLKRVFLFYIWTSPSLTLSTAAKQHDLSSLVTCFTQPNCVKHWAQEVGCKDPLNTLFFLWYRVMVKRKRLKWRDWGEKVWGERLFALWGWRGTTGPWLSDRLTCVWE